MKSIFTDGYESEWIKVSYLVTNCFEWVGYHIVHALLENGFHVDGIDGLKSEKQKHLSMFLGRNSSFQLITAHEMNHYDASFTVSNNHLSDQIKMKQTVHNDAEGKKGKHAKTNEVTINLPLLFGEWMPMDEKGVYHLDEYIPFHSDLFLTKAVYIKTFTESLLQWIQTPNIPSELFINRTNSDARLGIILDNMVYLRDNVSVEENIKTVSRHYQQFKEFY